jgi:hypothetical protein
MRNPENSWEAYFRRLSFRASRYQIALVLVIVALVIVAILASVRSRSDYSGRCDRIYALTKRPVYGRVVKKARRNRKASVGDVVVQDFSTKEMVYLASLTLDSASRIGDTILKSSNSRSGYLLKDGRRYLMFVVPGEPACEQWWRDHNPERARHSDSLYEIEKSLGLYD